MQGTKEKQVQSLHEEGMEEETATPSSVLAWEIPWTEEPAGPVHRVAKEPDKTSRLNSESFLKPERASSLE